MHGAGVSEGYGFAFRGADPIMEYGVKERDFEGILDSLDKSHDAVWKVAKLLNDRGYAVKVPVTTKATSLDDWKTHVDDGDLFIEQRIEVKQLSRDFKNHDDWPFDDKFIVCSANSFDRATPKPFAYVILSGCGGYAAAVFCSTQNEWYTEMRSDGRREGVRQKFYFCPMHKVKFFKMPQGAR